MMDLILFHYYSILRSFLNHKYFECIIYYNKNSSAIIKSFHIHYYKYKISERNL